jgi:hypothetical protein
MLQQLRAGDIVEIDVPRPWPWTWWQRALWRLSLRRWRPREKLERRSFVITDDVSDESVTVERYRKAVFYDSMGSPF